jgi:hypothetical protein
MKQLRFLATALAATSMSLFLSSCGSGGDEKKTEEAPKDTSTQKMTETPPPPPAKPGNVLIIKHKVANYAKWKPFYDAHDSARLAAGLKSYIIGRGTPDSNMVVIVMKMEDANKAKEMAGSKELKERMQKAGVISKPSFEYLNVVMNDTSAIPQTARLMVTHKVKDWDAWKKAFDSHKQARMDAGLIDRGLGYSIDDNHNVSIVFAVTDMAKAKAFTTSKDLKDKMAEAGVEGPPAFTWYNIVQKY